MNIQPINNNQNKSQIYFQGKVDKSVIKFFDKSFKVYKKEISSSTNKDVISKVNRYKNLIAQVKTILEDFMENCHPTTTLKIKDREWILKGSDIIIENSYLPTTPNINMSRRLSLRLPEKGQSIGIETLLEIIKSFDKNVNPKDIDRHLLKFSMNALEEKANKGNIFEKWIANLQLKKLEKFSKEINSENKAEIYYHC